MPTAHDFEQALWVSTTQNGIHQVWAPLYTMFSRGNIREKTRLLHHPFILSSATGECTAVDLYAGIGYFAFSYARAGVSKVLCWELNPWSVEGLSRGVERNNWTSTVFTTDNLPKYGREWAAIPRTDFLIFQQSNEEAGYAIKQLKGLIPPVRHVNCGFLPSSKLSWPIAMRIIDAKKGGWIHAHENVGVNDIEKRKGEIIEELQFILDGRLRNEKDKHKYGETRKVICEHVERVKTYAPGVAHVVFDLWVDGEESAKMIQDK